MSIFFFFFFCYVYFYLIEICNGMWQAPLVPEFNGKEFSGVSWILHACSRDSAIGGLLWYCHWSHLHTPCVKTAGLLPLRKNTVRFSWCHGYKVRRSVFTFLLTLWMSWGSHFLFFLLFSDCKVRMKIFASSISRIELALLQLISLYIYF